MTETRLKKLTNASLVTPEFVAGEEELTREDLHPYLQPTNIHVDLEPLHEKIESDVFGEYEQSDAAIDAEIAETVHRTLDLTRREASKTGLWHYLTVLEFPEFVRYRWRGRDVREKFLAGGKDIYSNALHRLWWIAEITSDGDDYTRTDEIFEIQELANDVADRDFARYQPITHACVDELNKEQVDQFDPQSSKIVSRATTLLNERLSVVVAESLSYDEAASLVRESRDEAVAELR